MKKKINIRFILISAMAIIVTAVSAMVVYYTILKKQIFADLKIYAHIIEQINIEEADKNSSTIYDPWEDELRITLIDPEGIVLYDSLVDETQMSNHKDRPEIQQAMQSGEGEAIRSSATVSMHTFYYAMKLPNGNVLRIGRDSESIKDITQTTIMIIVVISLLIFSLCILISYFLTKRLMEPVERMASNLALVDETMVYDEMKPVVATMKEQHYNIIRNVEMRQEFTANVSHELKTPLTAISGYAELIGSGMTDTEDTRRFAGEIHRNADRLLTLISDIIKLSELDESQQELEMEETDLYELAANCMELLSVTAEKQSVLLKLTGQSTTVTVNKGLIEELIYNLCSNAIRYNKSGGSVVITVGTREGHAYLRVADTGIGIPQEAQERVFERFYRVDKSRSKSTGGTGLGLALVKHIVEQHNAKITLESEPGIGTTIEVIL